MFFCEMSTDIVQNQYFFMKFQQALCRITTFEQKTLNYDRKSTFVNEHRETQH